MTRPAAVNTESGIERALRAYQSGDVSLGRAAEEAGLTQWELLDAVRRAGIAYPLDIETTRERLAQIDGGTPPTLPDIPPKPGGVLLVGIRLEQPARRFFPPKRSTVEVVLRGTRVTAGYDPRVGPDRNRSPVLRIGSRLGDLVRENEVLSVTRGLGGVLVLE